jgi:hypothetical protein
MGSVYARITQISICAGRRKRTLPNQKRNENILSVGYTGEAITSTWTTHHLGFAWASQEHAYVADFSMG